MDFDDDAPLDGGGDDLRSALASALDGDAGTHTPVEREPDAPPAADAGAAAKPAAERHRNERGEFATKPADAGAVTGDQPPATAAAPTEAPAQPAAAPRPAPNSWRAEAKDAWASIPPAAQEDILRREREADGERQQHAAARKVVQDFDAAATPHADMLRRTGGTPAQAFAVLLHAQSSLERDPVRAIQDIAQSYGLQITGMNRAAPQQRPAPAAPPRQAPPADPRAIFREEMARHTQEQRTAEQIQAFAKTAPHLDAVRGDVANLLRAAHAAGQEMTLQDAYERATWANPAIRQQLIAAQAAPAAPPVQPAAAPVPSRSDPAAVARARAAAGSVRGAPGGTSAKPADRSLREEIAAQLDGVR